MSKFRDPVSGLTHLAGAGLGVIGWAYLLAIAAPRPGPPTIAVLIYGASLILLYLASSAYHLFKVSDQARLILRRLDHAMVPVFIAGTYTPFCVIGLGRALGVPILLLIWGLAFAGLIKSIVWIHSPRWVTAGIYVLMGWVVVFVAYPLSKTIPSAGLFLLFAGGVSYSVGALVYAKKWPDPWPPIFGFHEIWHLFVLAGSACHYASVLTLFD